MRTRIVTLIVVIAGWWLLSRGASDFGLPGPEKVGQAFLNLIAGGKLSRALGVTLSSFAVGGALSVLVGVPLGILMGVRPWFGRAVDPYLTGLYVMPMTAVIPLFVLWFGVDELVRMVFIFVFTVPQVAMVCYQGARSTPATLVEVAKTYMGSGRQIFWKVIMPYEVPFIFTSLRLGVGLAIQGMVVAEILITSVNGIGYLIQTASATLDLATVLAVVIFIMILGIAAVFLMQRVEKSVAPWRQETSSAGGSNA